MVLNNQKHTFLLLLVHCWLFLIYSADGLGHVVSVPSLRWPCPDSSVKLTVVRPSADSSPRRTFLILSDSDEARREED